MPKLMYIQLQTSDGRNIKPGCDVTIHVDGKPSIEGKFKTLQRGIIVMRQDVYAGKLVKIICCDTDNQCWGSENKVIISRHVANIVPISLSPL
jgi:hypothetical protein